MTRNRWMKFWPADWRADPALRSVSAAARGLWIDLITLMHESDPYGHLLIGGQPPTPRMLASVLSMREKEVVSLLNDLRSAGVCSETAEGILYSRRMVRDAESQETARVIGSRGGNPNLKRDKGGVNPPVNPPVNLEAEAEAEKEEEPPKPPVPGGGEVVPVPPPDPVKVEAPKPDPFDAFWAAYPRKVGKDDARKKFAQATKAGATPDEIMAGLKRTTFDTREGGRFIPYPATWLNQGRWKDQGIDLDAAKPDDDEPVRFAGGYLV